MSSAPLPTDWVRVARAKLKEADQDFHKVNPLIYWRDMIVSGVCVSDRVRAGRTIFDLAGGWISVRRVLAVSRWFAGS